MQFKQKFIRLSYSYSRKNFHVIEKKMQKIVTCEI
jgi:hypothetical protein